MDILPTINNAESTPYSACIAVVMLSVYSCGNAEHVPYSACIAVVMLSMCITARV
ncbi:hypothetical protein DPMN_086976 [Dreissena polymorpha]|uniref:Uncharacterized protein n=1 Tax=Dreissena polymorpha TaxID=45954 RepID=A0A9D4KRD9_DREPO|nr:hypothetical protein DPMN_086976 [Dreissena polymorpha]